MSKKLELPKQSFIFYTNIAFEPWDYNNGIKKGIGGSETSIVEMSWRLARKGHDVTVYAPIKKSTKRLWRGVKWHHYKNANFKKKGIWILYRCPDAADHFTPKRKDQKIWLLWQDWDYGNFTKRRHKRIDMHITLCKAHGEYILRKYKEITKDKVWLTSNGIKRDLIDEVNFDLRKKAKRFAFDVNGVIAHNESARQLARDVYAAGHEVYIVPAMAENVPIDYAGAMKALNVPYNAIYRVNHPPKCPASLIAKRKLLALKAIKADYFFDDKQLNVSYARKAGIKAFVVNPNKPIKRPKFENVFGRNPHRIMYASSPDRGLLQGLKIFKKAREYVPDLEFYAFYGFNNLDKLIKGHPESGMAKNKEKILELLKQPGVHFGGRINQIDLMKEWFKSGIYLYITDFFETSHISGMEAQACGAVPVFSPIFAQKENIRHGIAVEGRSLEMLTISRAAAEVVKLCFVDDLQTQIRNEMIPWALERFDWEIFVDQWIYEAAGYRKKFEKIHDFPEQL